MPQWLTATLRWVLAVGLAVWAFVAIGPMVVEQLGDAVGWDREVRELPEVGQAVGPPPLIAGRTEAVANVGSSLGTVQTLSGPTVSVGSSLDTLLVGFEAIPQDPACLAGVALEIRLIESVETGVHVMPARVDGLTELEDGQGLPANHLLDRSNPAGAYTTGAPGWLRFDVRGPYQLAARATADDELVVLAVRLPEETDVDGAATFATVDDAPPRLRWAAIEGCDDDPITEEAADPLDEDEPADRERE